MTRRHFWNRPAGWKGQCHVVVFIRNDPHVKDVDPAGKCDLWAVKDIKKSDE